MQCKFVTYALWPYEAQTEEELSFQENDILLVTDVEDEGWWIAVPKSADTFGDAKRGLVPTSYLQELEPIVCATSIYPYDAATDDELSFPEGATLTVYDTSDPDWWFAKYENQVGLVPKTYVEADGDVPVQEAAPPVDHVSTPAPQPQPQPQQQATVADGKNPEAQKKQLLSALDGLGFQSRKSSSKGSIENLAPTDIVYWNITEIDKKKKKNSSKGQMGVTDDFIIYFVSDDANRDIIARWELAEVTGISEKKGKRLLLEIAGDEHQFEGDKADIQGLLARLQNMQNKRKLAAAGGPMSPAALPTASTIPAPRAQAVAQQPPPQPPRSFAPPEVKTEVPPTVQFQLPAQVAAPASDGGPKIAVALYDYEAQGADELSIKENDNLAVLDDSDPEWWKVRLVSKRGGGGLVPASYVQLKRRLDEQGTPSSQVDARIVDADNQRRQQEENHRRQQEELERQRQEQERKHREQEEARQREEEQRRRREEQERRTREEAEQRRKAEEEMRRVPQATASASARQVPTHAPTRPAPSVPGPPKMPPRPDMHAPRPEKPNHPPQTTPHAASSGNGTVRNVPKAETDKPNLSKIRTWTDRSGSFRVEAEFLNVGDGKVHLHKVNGVKIAVPLSKLDPKDVEFIRSLPGHSHIQAPAAQAAVPPPRLGVTNDILAAARNVPVPDAPEGPVSYNGFNWKEFLVKAGVAPGDSSMYAQKFVQEKMDRSHLADMDRSLLRGLGVAEGDILRITKAGKAQAIPAVSLAAVQGREDEALQSNLQKLNRVGGNATEQSYPGSRRNTAKSGGIGTPNLQAIQQAAGLLQASSNQASNRSPYTSPPQSGRTSARSSVSVGHGASHDPWAVSTPTATAPTTSTAGSSQAPPQSVHIAQKQHEETQKALRQAQEALQKAQEQARLTAQVQAQAALMKAQETAKHAALLQEQTKQALLAAQQAAVSRQNTMSPPAVGTPSASGMQSMGGMQMQPLGGMSPMRPMMPMQSLAPMQSMPAARPSSMASLVPTPSGMGSGSGFVPVGSGPRPSHIQDKYAALKGLDPLNASSFSVSQAPQNSMPLQSSGGYAGNMQPLPSPAMSGLSLGSPALSATGSMQGNYVGGMNMNTSGVGTPGFGGQGGNFLQGVARGPVATPSGNMNMTPMQTPSGGANMMGMTGYGHNMPTSNMGMMNLGPNNMGMGMGMGMGMSSMPMNTNGMAMNPGMQGGYGMGMQNMNPGMTGAGMTAAPMNMNGMNNMNANPMMGGMGGMPLNTGGMMGGNASNMNGMGGFR